MASFKSQFKGGNLNSEGINAAKLIEWSLQIFYFQADDENKENEDNKEEYFSSSSICSSEDDSDDDSDTEEYSDDDDVPAVRGSTKVWDYFYIFNHELLDGRIEVIYLKKPTHNGNTFQICNRVRDPLIFYPSRRVSQ